MDKITTDKEVSLKNPTTIQVVETKTTEIDKAKYVATLEKKLVNLQALVVKTQAEIALYK